jgi:hypothetical protein
LEQVHAGLGLVVGGAASIAFAVALLASGLAASAASLLDSAQPSSVSPLLLHCEAYVGLLLGSGGRCRPPLLLVTPDLDREGE